MSLHALDVNNVSIGYESEKILFKNLSFSIRSGVTAIIGVNGSGKSTLIKSIAGLLPVKQGNIVLDQKDISAFSTSEKARKISILLTHRPRLPYFSVFDFVAMGRSPYTSLSGKLTSADVEQIETAMMKCGIVHLRKKLVDEISDGERQKCALACAIAQQTPLILLDEPTTFLDFRSRYSWMELLQSLAMQEGKIILFTSHDLDAVFHFSNQCLVISENGKAELVSKETYSSSVVIQELLKDSALKFEGERLRFTIPNE